MAETVEVRLRVTYDPLSTGTPVEEIVQDLADQCHDMLLYQHKDNEDALVVVERVERVPG